MAVKRSINTKKEKYKNKNKNEVKNIRIKTK